MKLRVSIFAIVCAALAASRPVFAFDTSTANLRRPNLNAAASAGAKTTLPAVAGNWNGATANAPLGNPLTDHLPFSPAEQLLFADAANGKLEHYMLLEAALVACGVNDRNAWQRYRQKFASARAELLQSIRDSKSNLATTSNSPTAQTLSPGERGQGEREEEQRIRLIHQVLHQRLLSGGYDANATNLAATLETGIYNCASATLLFTALASELGLPVHAVELPGHVRARIESGAEVYEVEVTCSNWPQALKRTSKSAAAAAWSGANNSMADSPEREVSLLGLVAMIYYNRGVDAFNDRQFAEAIAANRRALLLDRENQTARGNLLAAVNNWALALCDAGRYAEAESLLQAGRQFDPTHQAFVHNLAHVEQQWAQSQAGAISGGNVGRSANVGIGL